MKRQQCPASHEAQLHARLRQYLSSTYPRKIRAMVDAAEHPLRVGHDSKQAKPRAIGRRAVDRENVFWLRCSILTTLAPGHGRDSRPIADWPVRRPLDRRSSRRPLQARRDHRRQFHHHGHQELHLRNAENRNTENLRAHTKRRFNTERSTSNAELRKLSRLHLTLPERILRRLVLSEMLKLKR